jgi:hypothetical protein
VELIPGSAAVVAERHPLDPEPARSSKARVVFALGLLAFLTGPLVGGLVPATVAFVLGRQARREAYASGGYLTGAAWLRRGERLAWVGVVLAGTALVAAAIIGLLDYAGTPGTDFGSQVD